MADRIVCKTLFPCNVMTIIWMNWFSFSMHHLQMFATKKGSSVDVQHPVDLGYSVPDVVKYRGLPISLTIWDRVRCKPLLANSQPNVFAFCFKLPKQCAPSFCGMYSFNSLQIQYITILSNSYS